jgi:hypothetical protein
MTKFTKKDCLETILIAILVLMFPLIWLLNQRLNYRKFLTLNTKLSLNSNILKSKELSSPTSILQYFNKNNLETTMSYKVGTTQGFSVLGRTLVTNIGDVEVYEYENNSDALKEMNHSLVKNFLIPYKNLLIYNKNNIAEVKYLMEKNVD